jgi:cell division protein FtsQ
MRNKIRDSKRTVDINTARKRTEFLRKFLLFSKILTVGFICLFFATSLFDNFKSRTREKFLVLTSKYLDFTLSKILIDGQENISNEEIIKIINTKINTPILATDISKIQKNLEKNDWIKRAIVERRLPDKLYVGIIERKPIARWQYKQKIMLIDDEAVVIKNKPKQDYHNLVLVVGADAYFHAADLIEDTKNNQELFSKIEAAVRFGERRWDLKFIDGLTAKMPEENFKRAWEDLSKLHKAQKLFTQNIKVIDLRDKDKYYITRSD